MKPNLKAYWRNYHLDFCAFMDKYLQVLKFKQVYGITEVQQFYILWAIGCSNGATSKLTTTLIYVTIYRHHGELKNFCWLDEQGVEKPYRNWFMLFMKFLHTSVTVHLICGLNQCPRWLLVWATCVFLRPQGTDEKIHV